MSVFTKGELNVMRILWEHNEQKPSEIQGKFPHPIKNSALRSYLTILMEKGHVTRRRKGKAYYYKAITRQESAFRWMLRDFADAFCGGSAEALICRLIKTKKLSEQDLLHLKKISDGLDDVT